MIVLDTNVISALMRERPDTRVVGWLDAQPSESVWTTSVTVFEVRFGLLALPRGKRRGTLEAAFETMLTEDLGGRVLEFDAAAARSSAEIAGTLRGLGRPVEVRDVMIAGTVASRRGVLATGNGKHFVRTGVRVVDPWVT